MATDSTAGRQRESRLTDRPAEYQNRCPLQRDDDRPDTATRPPPSSPRAVWREVLAAARCGTPPLLSVWTEQSPPLLTWWSTCRSGMGRGGKHQSTGEEWPPYRTLGCFKDNDPKPTPRLCKGYLTKTESGVLHQMTWPPQSPDLISIEMVWDELDRRVKEKQPTSAQHTWELRQDCWKSIPGRCLTYWLQACD
ncbi:uncharacterized protein LOC127929518 isoform X2 [Oncorhynchus keta]|uniref:uncharacterized protein LOC127929518 isoform X2 n=1 Tax=Oncorhynchus keta TaxID=8018 RepID=UPI00227CDDD1|nr:uncharacterized protein LOC127929518 isoform X2 [Oncorhynchus keta]